MEPKAYSIEHLRCSTFQEKGKTFDLCRYEEFIQETGLSSEVHRHNYYMILAATHGRGRHLVDFRSYDIEPRTICLMSPGQVHAWEKDDQLRGYLIFFTPDFFTLRYNNNNLLEFPFFNSSHSDPYITIDEENWPRLLTLLHLMLREYEHRSDDFIKSLRSYLNILLVECSRFYNADYRRRFPADQNTTLIVRNFERLIEEHFHEKHHVQEYAEMLVLTPNYLNAVCNKGKGRPAGELIRERIMLEARRLLLHDGSTVAEIGNTLNFTDNSYFGRFFKKYEGISPEKFRKKYRTRTI